MTTVLIAETDRHTLDVLPRILSDHLPHIAIDSCTSVEELSRKLKEMSYDTIAISSLLVPHYRFLTHKSSDQSHAPLLVTAGQWDRTLAYRAITKRIAFDLIIKPIIPQDVASTVRLALWQNRLHALVASRERMFLKYQEHMTAYPEDLKSEAQLASRCAVIDSTLGAIKVSMHRMVSVEEESSFIEMAAAVEEFTRKRARGRLLSLYEDSPVC